MSESAFLILHSLQAPQHGYRIMEDIHTLASGRVKLGAGMMHGTIRKLCDDRLIDFSCKEDIQLLLGEDLQFLAFHHGTTFCLRWSSDFKKKSYC